MALQDTLIIFDWDDTLCPTTHAANNKDCIFRDTVELKKHDQVAAELVRFAATLGHVVVVSMAGHGWIEETMAKYMPRTQEAFEELEISISLSRVNVPAREKRAAFEECREPSTFLKRRSMAKVIRKFYQERSWKNIISIGDSLAERHALQDLVLRRVQEEECSCKTVKLMDEPSLVELSAQLMGLKQWLQPLVEQDGDIDIDFEEQDLKDCMQLLAGFDSRDLSSFSDLSTTASSSRSRESSVERWAEN